MLDQKITIIKEDTDLSDKEKDFIMKQYLLGVPSNPPKTGKAKTKLI